jgi:membrane-associated phospholipid phosphatase
MAVFLPALPLDPNLSPAWLAVTRLGEAQLALPATLAAIAWVALRANGPDLRTPAGRWALWLAAAIALTTATKLAFIGWGLGYAPMDFTGISGHSLFAAASYPLLLRLLAAGRGPRAERAAWVAGVGVAAVVAVSRVMVSAHSGSEVILGFMLGTAVSVLAWPGWQLRRALPSFTLAAALAVWLALHVPAVAGGLPSVDTHGMVTRLAMVLSAREAPYTRHDLHRDAAERTARVDLRR